MGNPVLDKPQIGLIFEQSKHGRQTAALRVGDAFLSRLPEPDFPSIYLRKKPAMLPEVTELEVVRHYTRLSQQNFSIDSHFYPLGSCTMKYNPKIAHRLAMLPGLIDRHPYASAQHSQGILSCLFELQEMLQHITGMAGVCLTPMAGAQGELAGVLMMRAHHIAKGQPERLEMLVPDSAHGTNPASAVMAGFRIKEIPTNAEGDLDLAALEKALGPHTAGIMLTNPSTLGLFERQIEKIAQMVHSAGGLLYYDGANLNAILGRVRPGDMGFDVLHFNLHKTFATPHGGGGPGAGPIAVSKTLLPYLPVPRVRAISDPKSSGGMQYAWLEAADCPQSIGQLSAFMGNVGILLRAAIYLRLLGKQGLRRVSDMATLNANYVMRRLQGLGFVLAYPVRQASHEFIITFKKWAKEHHVTAMELAKRLLDYGIHAPTTYFPLCVPECWLIEPTETENLETLDRFIEVMQQIEAEVQSTPEWVKTAPHTLPVKRLDDVRAVKFLDVVYHV
jgi:glycine dehydrogenase subunit 2